MATYTTGEALMCCVAREKAGNLNTQRIHEIWNGDHYKQARIKMLKGEQVSACQKCYDEEAGGVNSHRIIQNYLWEEEHSKNEGHVGKDHMDMLIDFTREDGTLDASPISFDFRLGNTCNLQCIMCGPKDSSKWVTLAKQLKQIEKWDTSKFSWVEDQDFWTRDFEPLLPNINHLILAGGEPMYLKQHIPLLERIVALGHAKHIKIRYHTNATITPSNRLFELWSEFEHIDLCMSIDCYEEKNSYIRYPDHWNDILDTLHMVDSSPDNIGPRINCTINAINIFYMPEYVEWLQRQKFKKVSQSPISRGLPFVGYVHSPIHLNCKVLPYKIKKVIADKFDEWYNGYDEKWYALDSIYKAKQFMLEEDKSEHFREFQRYIDMIDKVRGTHFIKTFPELAALYDTS